MTLYEKSSEEMDSPTWHMKMFRGLVSGGCA